MSWQDDHNRGVEEFPAHIREAHSRSIHHRAEVETSKLCGCFYCCRTFPPAQIEQWVDDDDTALCPFCAIDSVIAEGSGFPLTAEFLSEMRAHWFDEEPDG